MKLNNTKIEVVNKVRNLGVTFNKNLTWTDHVNGKIGHVYNMLRHLWLTQHCTPFRIRMLLAKTYLVPTLLYGCEIFVNPDCSSFHNMEKLFNNIARYIFKKRKYDHISQYTKLIFGMTLRASFTVLV